MKWLRWLLRGITLLYGLACLYALAILAIYTQGWFGMSPEPLASLYALVLALPWTLLFQQYDPGATLYVVLFLLVAMGINLTILLALQRWVK